MRAQVPKLTHFLECLCRSLRRFGAAAISLFFLSSTHAQLPQVTPAPESLPATAPSPSPTPLLRDLSILDEARDHSIAQVFSPAELGKGMPAIKSMKAVRITLDFSPQIALQETEIVGTDGTVRVAQGEFDTHVTARAQSDLRHLQRDQNNRATPQSSATPYPNPLVRRSSFYEFEVGLIQKLRNGVVLTPKVGYRPRFEKDYNAFENTNEGFASFDVFIPLAKGGGRVVNEAPEIAARFDLLASVLQLRYVTSASIRDTIQAYWRCRGAEERYLLYVESEKISSRLLQLSTTLAEADELAPAELPQILADHHTTMALRVQAEVEVILARQRLAVAMGLSPETLAMAPMAADPFPQPVPNQKYPEISELEFAALSLRDDLRASKQLESSRKTLMDASYLELRPRLDLQLQATYLPYQTRNTQMVTDAQQWGGLASLNFDWPIQNNTAIGRNIQDTAAYSRTLIDTETLKRTISAGVITAFAEIRGSAAASKIYADAARFNLKALSNQEELFRLGQANLTDTITIRQRLVTSQIDAVNALERYAIALVQLRFETGTLFATDEAGGWITAESWTTIPLRTRK